ncbi:MAG: hypothetical protein WCT10_05615 [Patescibacteria group bacterium]|jgi:hypothetical protein
MKRNGRITSQIVLIILSLAMTASGASYARVEPAIGGQIRLIERGARLFYRFERGAEKICLALPGSSFEIIAIYRSSLIGASDQYFLRYSDADSEEFCRQFSRETHKCGWCLERRQQYINGQRPGSRPLCLNSEILYARFDQLEELQRTEIFCLKRSADMKADEMREAKRLADFMDKLREELDKKP